MNWFSKALDKVWERELKLQGLRIKNPLSCCSTYNEALEISMSFPNLSNSKVSTCDVAYLPMLKKNGKPGKRFGAVRGPEYTKLKMCEGCGKWKNPGLVRYIYIGWLRSSYYYIRLGAEDYELQCKTPDFLCVSCSNKVRPLYKATKLLDEIEMLISKIERELSKRRPR